MKIIEKLIVGAVLSGSVTLAGGAALAQNKPAASPAVSAPVAATVKHTEITVLDGWTLTCADNGAAGAKKNCSAELHITQNIENQPPRTVFSWLVGMKDGKPLSVLQVPTGVNIPAGIEVKLGNKDARKFGYVACLPAICEVAVPMDEAFIKDASVDKADVTVTGADGRGVKFTVNMTSFDKVVAEIRK